AALAQSRVLLAIYWHVLRHGHVAANNALIYSGLELVSLVVVHVILKRFVHLSPVYFLAVVLERHAKMVQTHLFIWMFFCHQLDAVPFRYRF
ncbi:TPA: hypothetical protein N0F65_012768, partial [Lagenidium giganteum]